jgi:hypothetical protein
MAERKVYPPPDQKLNTALFVATLIIDEPDDGGDALFKTTREEFELSDSRQLPTCLNGQ